MTETTCCREATIEMIKDITEDWDDAFEGEITGATQIARDLEFDSLDVVHLITAIEQRYERVFAFDELLMVDGQFVQDLTIDQIAQFVQQSIEDN